MGFPVALYSQCSISDRNRILKLLRSSFKLYTSAIDKIFINCRLGYKTLAPLQYAKVSTLTTASSPFIASDKLPYDWIENSLHHKGESATKVDDASVPEIIWNEHLSQSL